jgi:tetratricopeptide (TPR) repeat protein
MGDGRLPSLPSHGLHVDYPPQRGWEAWGLKTLGDVHAHGDDKGEAEQAGEAYRQALALATELGMRPLVAHCHHGLGKLYARSGQRDEAREHLTTAVAMYRDMDMRFWPEKAEAEPCDAR